MIPLVAVKDSSVREGRVAAAVEPSWQKTQKYFFLLKRRYIVFKEIQIINEMMLDFKWNLKSARES